MLSVVFGLTRFHTYTYGRKVTVYNDHKPLAAVLKRPVGENPIRFQRCCAELWDMTLTSCTSKAKTCLSLMPLADPTWRNNQKENLMLHSIPDRPWSKIPADLFEFKEEHYLVLVDYYSDRIEFDKMRDQTGTETISLLLKQLSRWGRPDEIVTGCGNNFDTKDLSQFCQRKHIKHTKSSPHHHQSNGKAESAVKIPKAILRKTENSALNPFEALLDQHTTPTVDMTTSPAQRFLHRRLKSEIPMEASLHGQSL
ncbi:uncharacterized protein [Montipora foliosa]|uniref:uncharacterized protein n=1 Tax=Montipora foliosa TaxID=591990 RepID=UPI0035F16336